MTVTRASGAPNGQVSAGNVALDVRESCGQAGMLSQGALPGAEASSLVSGVYQLLLPPAGKCLPWPDTASALSLGQASSRLSVIGEPLAGAQGTQQT